ncbi:MAG: Ni/Fe hydrogenase subunit alpha [Desulfofustis sp. PB-SRB1]|jgi:coenzyme F420-reducing hydrogenase alpha subunit|nr:Ni/Fe hydrogenase subunit alpha [Desulfofustis sp. PB-SRB1]MBM1004076.1 Ni/Fe hydrogenase subunit alpha [Desulfofustis sp. PB-SRB1]HBH28634.1 Ni/Fe hydrogenase subunit alpha [Desulfofustis sp.]HBH32094.1 Ni/Fe hydrogenase subunit alpha [Desulfofustis sp.]
MNKTITIDPVTRIEGHAKILLECNEQGAVDEAFFIVNELRGFERILVGMEAHTLPQVTARICGVCPTAHHLASAKALDNAAGVEPPPAGKLLRELMYMGHMIHSHALSLFVLAGPDLVFGLGGEAATQNIVGMVEANPELTKKGLRVRSIGQKINEVIGGRGIHPVTAIAGGISARLSDDQHARVSALSTEAVTLVNELSPTIKDMLLKLLDDNPVLLDKLNLPSWYLGTVNGGKLNVYDGLLRAMDDTGAVRAEFEAGAYADYLVERAVRKSYAKEVYLDVDGAEHMYRVSTLARMNVADGMETPLAQKEFEEFRDRFGRPCHNAILQMYCKLVELVYACEKAHEIINHRDLRGETRVPASIKGTHGIGHVEAPRGVLIHDYKIDAEGIVRGANMIIATQQNTAAINASLKESGADLLAGGNDEQVLNGLEFVVRCYDPCLACSTHAVGQMELTVEVAHQGRVMRRLAREV